MTSEIKSLFVLALCCFTTAKALDCERGPPPWKNIGECCPNIFHVPDELKNFCLDKVSTIDDDTMIHAFPPKLRCMYECILNETGIYSHDTNSLNEDNLDEFLKTIYENATDMITVAKEAFQTCAEKEIEFLQREEEHHPGKLHKCKLFLLHCVKFRIFENCPESIWVKSPECDDSLDFMKNCKPPHLRGGPGHIGPHHHHGPPPPPPPNDD